MPSLITRSSTPVRRTGEETDDPSSESLAIDVPKQDQERWCWAAIGLALASFYEGADPSRKQDQIAGKVMPAKDCINHPASCNKDMVMEIVLRELGFERKDGGPKMTGMAPFEELQQELEAGRPVVLRVVPISGRPHFVLLKGYQRELRALEIDDPGDGDTTTASYEALKSGQSRWGQWTETHWTQGKA